MEYLSDVEGELTDVELDHWAYGPHHLWSYPESGQILRMWQPFNGLQVSLAFYSTQVKNSDSSYFGLS